MITFILAGGIGFLFVYIYTKIQLPEKENQRSYRGDNRAIHTRSYSTSPTNYSSPTSYTRIASHNVSSSQQCGFSYQQRQLLAAKRVEENESNVFSAFYAKPRSPPPESADKPLHTVQRLLKAYKHSDAIEFAASSWIWKDNIASELATLYGLQARGQYMYSSESGTLAYYRVLTKNPTGYVLVACHVNVHGLHRGDLRYLEVNDKTKVKGLSGTSIVGRLFIGDVVAVTELALLTAEGFRSPVTSTSQIRKCTWMVKMMTLLTREVLQDCIFATLENGNAVVKGQCEVMNVKDSEVDIIPKLNPEIIYKGHAFVPQKMLSHFTEDIDPEFKNSMIAKSSCICQYPTAFGTIYNYSESYEHSEKFEIGTKALKNGTTEYGESAVELCALMGYSAANSVFNGRMDCRSFPLLSLNREGLIVRFSIDNPEEQPTEGKWCSNLRIKFGGSCGELNGVIETVTVLDNNRKILITARLPKGSAKDFNFKDGVYIVKQREPLENKVIDGGFFSNLSDFSNGKKIITTLYGGARLGKLTVNKKEIYFPSSPKMKLNEYQAEYVSMILGGTPIVIGSSPFGCGKSMTIVTAALEVFEMFNGKQLLITQSNYASVNLVDIARKVEKEDGPAFLRYVSESNWKELPDNCRTEYDYPQLLRQKAKDWGTGCCGKDDDDRLGRINRMNLLYFIIDQKLLQPHELNGIANSLYEQNKTGMKKPFMKKLLEAFFILYKPDIIMVTADSVQAIADDLENVRTIQIDEASQLPEYTFLYLLSKFSDANFGLIGDIRQLPPYCEEDLTGKLKEYGIGNTMERAIEEHMFPQAILRYVYRCHPVTTQLLSELFYEGQLLSDVTEEMRNEFMRRRPDFWPNPKFPVLILDNSEKGYRIGTSCGNRMEVDVVKNLIFNMTKVHNGYKLKPKDIGVISFYAAQTSILIEALRGTGVKCGTVDAFQGSEREVVILCCTNEKPSEFMQLANRLNVAMSRARQATIIIGNVQGLRRARYWSTILERAEANHCVGFQDKPTNSLNQRAKLHPKENEKLKGHPGRGGKWGGRGRGRGRGWGRGNQKNQ